MIIRLIIIIAKSYAATAGVIQEGLVVHDNAGRESISDSQPAYPEVISGITDSVFNKESRALNLCSCPISAAYFVCNDEPVERVGRPGHIHGKARQQAGHHQ